MLPGRSDLRDRGGLTSPVAPLLNFCESFAPEVFEVQPDGSLVLLTDEPSEGISKAVRAAVESCPVEAISLEEIGHTS